MATTGKSEPDSGPDAYINPFLPKQLRFLIAQTLSMCSHTLLYAQARYNIRRGHAIALGPIQRQVGDSAELLDHWFDATSRLRPRAPYRYPKRKFKMHVIDTCIYNYI